MARARALWRLGMNERKLVGRSVAITLGIICLTLAACLIGAFAFYLSSIVDDKNIMISSLSSQAKALQNQITSDNSTIDSLNSRIVQLETQLAANNSLVASGNATISYLQSQVTTLQNQVENLQNQIAELLSGEQVKLGSPYGWSNGTTTVNLRVSCPGGNAFTISGIRINGVNCPTFSGSNGLSVAPQTFTILSITNPTAFLSSHSYTIVLTTAKNNDQTTGTVP